MENSQVVNKKSIKCIKKMFLQKRYKPQESITPTQQTFQF